jgi:hypothetical protein
MSEIEKIDKILKSVLNNLEILTEKNRNIDISVLWTRLIDDNLKGKCYVLYEKGGNLYIKVENSCSLFSLRMQKKQIMDKLKEYGFSYKDIKFLI